MKTEIHPKYEKTTIKCACGNEFETRSTVSPEIQVELCSVCHPFYTGKQKFIDTAGRVDKFQARMKKAAEVKKSTKNPSTPKATKDKEEAKTNQDALKEIKKEITKPARSEERSGGAPESTKAESNPTTPKATQDKTEN